MEPEHICPMCRGTKKVYPEYLRGNTVALDTVPGCDRRVPCPYCTPENVEEPT